jgi:plasmid stabilization system protein ParE
VIPVEIDAAALAEAVEAQEFYAAQRPGLGDEFAAELDKAMARIAAYPTVWPPFSDRTRRYLMDRFPYSVVYRLSGETARVVAVFHQHRRPEYWRSRLP